MPTSRIVAAVVATVCATLGLLVAGGPAASAAGLTSTTWAKAQAIDPTYGGLNSVSCTSATECRAANNQARVLHFDGRSWTGGRRFATPAQVADGATLTAMTCATASFCAADVTSSAEGSKSGLVTLQSDHWKFWGQSAQDISCVSATFCIGLKYRYGYVVFNGSRWSASMSAGLDKTEQAVSCGSSSMCVMTSSDGKASTYNGRSWSTPQTIDAGHSLTDVDCRGTGVCTAVDDAGNALRYTGGQWGAAKQIDTVGISSVSCSSAAFCAAVDRRGDAMVYGGGKDAWTPPATIQADGDLREVSCPVSTFCAAVTTQGSVIRRVSGQWQSPQSVNPAVGGPSSVSCAGTTFCALVDRNGAAATYNGSSWSTPARITTLPIGFVSLSCPSAGFCMALTKDGHAVSRTASGWSSTMTVNGLTVDASDVSCTSSTFCLAMGLGPDDSDTQASAWNGSTWSEVTVPHGDTGVDYGSLSCAVDGSGPYCITFGKYASGDVLRYSDGAFAPAAQPMIADGKDDSYSFALSCRSSVCMALTQSINEDSTDQDAFTYNGATWTAVTLPAKFFVQNDVLSCASSTSCVAVDTGTESSTWNGSAWGPSTPTHLPATGDIGALSCATGICAAIDPQGYAVIGH